MDAAEKCQWYCPTPGWLVLGSLLVTGLIWLSNWLEWPTWHKGYAVLAAVAGVGLVLAVMLLWWLVALVFRWRFQFSVRTMLVLTLAVALPCSWLAVEMKDAREQKEAVEAVVGAGGSALYDFQIDRRSNPTKSTVPGPAWMRKVLGSSFFTSVVGVEVVCNGTDTISEKVEYLPRLQILWLVCYNRMNMDSSLMQLRRMTQLQDLDLTNCEVTDKGLKHLEGLVNLRSLNLCGDTITEQAVKRLQRALPNCKIYSDFH